MKTLTASVFLMAALLAQSSFANPTASDFGSIKSFLEQNFEGKNFASEKTEYVIEEGRLVAENFSTKIIRDVIAKNNRLTFDVISVNKRTLFKIDGAGNRVFWKTDDSVNVIKYLYTKRQSADKIIGISYALTESGWENAGQLFLENGRLVLAEKSVGDFVDAYSAEGNGWKPARFVTTTVFEMEGEKPSFSIETRAYDYDLESGVDSRPYAEVMVGYKLID